MQLQREVLYGVSTRGSTEGKIGNAEGLVRTAPTVIAGARVEVREAFG
jgi:hypothetical protein